MRQLFCIFGVLFESSLKADLIYRTHFISRFAVDIFWYLAQILTFEVLYQHVPHIGGWNIFQTRIFLGVLFVVDALYMVLFSANLDFFSSKVSTGEVDSLLLKPVSTQFILSLYRIQTSILGNLLFVIAFLMYHIVNYPGEITFMNVLLFLFCLPLGLTAAYCFRFLISVTSFFLVNATSFHYLCWQFYKFAMRPSGTFPLWLRVLIHTLIPLAFVASFPSSVLFGETSLEFIIAAVMVCGAFLWLTHVFLQKCLRLYSGSSS